MKGYLEDRLDKKMNTYLSKLKNQDLQNPHFVLFKQNNKWLADTFDQQITAFYDEKIKKEIRSITLPSEMEKEIYLLNWVKVNGYSALKENYAKTQDFLFKVKSPFYDRLNFYRYEFNKKDNDPSVLFKDFINSWEGILIKRIADYRFAKIEELRNKYLQELYNRIEIMQKTNKLLKTVWNFFGLMWNPEENLTKSLKMEAIEKFAEFLKQNPAIMEIATLLGRYQGESKLIEERLAEEIVMDYEWQPIGNSPEEIVGATESKDLEHMFPAELVLLKDPVLKYIFYKKFIEGKLTTFEFISQDQVPVEKIKLNIVKTRVPEEKGPIILCIDTSSSMRGNPEQIAKALSLAIAKIALQEKRPCYMINFSTNLDVYDFSSVRNSVPNLIKFLSKSFSGSTDIEPAINHALNVMEKNEYFNADLLMISDLLTSDLSERTTAKINQLKLRRNRFHAIVIGTMGHESAASAFDNAWIYDPRDPFASERIIASLTDQVGTKYNNHPEAKNLLKLIKEGKVDLDYDKQ
ncbi:VWA domain-containing protein [Spiroplasma sp. DGKH1]|uniref:VWA domain-containing protein n=1 Tax=Spiroplasma sp. DGKH1 TaxID=3050074 RepID=UPI0034C64D16